MKKIFFYLIIFLNLSCSTSLLQKDCYRVILIENYLFKDYTLIEVEDNYNQYLILSDKTINLSNYNKIRINDILELQLQQVDTIVVIKPYSLKARDNLKEFTIENKLIWRNDTIRTLIYTSPNIKGNFYIE